MNISPPHIVIAPDSFKESLSAPEAAAAIERGCLRALPQVSCQCLPLSDGGEGFVQALLSARGGRCQSLEVLGPAGRPVLARYGLLPSGAAVLEMAQAAGLTLLTAAERDPLRATSYGVGQLLRHVLDLGVRHVVLGLGGSATNDGGAGMLQALGLKLLDAEGRALPQGAAALARLASLDASELDPRLQHLQLEGACDVTAPLTGPQGASAVFGPQKGASALQVAQLDAALGHWADVLRAAGFADTRAEAGSGAAGGLGFALRSVCGGRLVSGADFVLDAVGLDTALAQAQLVITGEGRLDAQSLLGKVPMRVLGRAQRAGVPCVALAGTLGGGALELLDAGFAGAFAVSPPLQPLPNLLSEAAHNLEATAAAVAGVYGAAWRQGQA